MLAETRDPAILNGFAKALGYDLDMTRGMGWPNVHYYGEHGGISWVWTGPETYEAHVMLMPEGRGRWGVKAGREALALMAMRGAKVLWARVSRPEIGIYAAASGMKDSGMTVVMDCGEGPVPCRIFEWRPAGCHL